MATPCEILQHSGYKYDFVNPPNELYYCLSCGEVARDLTMTLCCGKHYCQDYIKPFKDEGRPCPECSAENLNVFEHIAFRNAIRALNIYCTMKRFGCEWSGLLTELPKHVDQESGKCQFIPIKCSKGCGLLMQRTEIEYHLSDFCPKRLHVCEYNDCTTENTYEYIVTEHMPACDHRPMECPNNCMVGSIKQGVLKKHLETCRFLQIDCTIPGCDGKFTRDDTQRHKDKNFSRHIDLLARSFQEMEEKFYGHVSDFQRQADEHDRENAALKEKLFQCQAEKEKENAALKQELLQCQIQIKELSEVVQRLKSGIEHYSSQHVMLLAGVGPPYFFTISDFTARKINNVVWRSPAFYVHNGPKCSISLFPNGSSIIPDTYISVALYIMNGEFDDYVNWPVRCTIKVELRNQLADQNHYKQWRGFRLERPQHRTKVGYIGEESNVKCFISHGSLNLDTKNQICLLKNDMMHLFVGVDVHSRVRMKLI